MCIMCSFVEYGLKTYVESSCRTVTASEKLFELSTSPIRKIEHTMYLTKMGLKYSAIAAQMRPSMSVSFVDINGNNNCFLTKIVELENHKLRLAS